MGAGDPTERGSGGRIGAMLTLAEKFPSGAFHVLSGESRGTRRVAKSSLAAEIFAAAESLVFAASVRALRADALSGNIPLAVCSDCESLFGHIKRGKRLSGNNLREHFLRLQQNIARGPVGNVYLL